MRGTRKLPFTECLSPLDVTGKEDLKLDNLSRKEVYLAHGSVGCMRSMASAFAWLEGFCVGSKHDREGKRGSGHESVGPNLRVVLAL